MEIVNNKAVKLKLKNPNRVTTVIPKSKKLGEHEVLVHWGLEETKVLRNMNIKVPSPIEKRYNWPGRYKPFKHQITTSSFLTLNQRCFCFSEMGCGKTASAIWAADYLMNIGKIRRALVVCPLSIMDSAWRSDLFNFAMHRRVDIAHGSKDKRKKVIQSGAEFVIINYEGMEIVEQEIKDGGFDLIIVDECFVEGTSVLTPEGKKPIETLRAGDMVLTSNGVSPIRRLVRNTSETLVRVHLNDGTYIDCTPEHPFFTDRGWICAKNIAGRRLISEAEVRRMRSGVFDSDEQVELAQAEGHEDWIDLLSILRTEEMASVESGQVLLQQYATGATRNTQGLQTHIRAKGSNFSAVESHRPQTPDSEGQRHGYDRGGEPRQGSAGLRMGMELPRSVGQEAARLSYELQARFCQSEDKSGFRSGRCEPPINRETRSRPQERSEAGGTWVERVSHIQQRGKTPVYNVEVEGTPNYFVGNGHLVHNCNAYKNAQSKRWKCLNRLLTPDMWLWMMTGTPAAQTPTDAYGLAKLVAPSKVPRFFGSFRDQVMNKITQFKWAPKPDAIDTVHRVLQPAIRYTKEECLDLPEMTYSKRYVDLTPQQKKYYKELKKKAIMQADGEEVTAANAAIIMNKLLQISSGSVYSDNRESLMFDIKNRYKVLKEVVEESPNKVLVFAPFKHVIGNLKERLVADGISTEIINGDVPVGKRTDIFKRFQNTPDPQVMVIQPQAAAHGVTLTAADTVVWWGPTSSLEIYAQANARVHRTGQKNKTTVVQLQGSPVEKHIYSLLDNRIDVHTKMLDLYKKIVD